jgi:hypothetical protein
VLKSPSEVEVISDARYLVKGVNEWLAGWVRRHWRRTDMKLVESENKNARQGITTDDQGVHPPVPPMRRDPRMVSPSPHFAP